MKKPLDLLLLLIIFGAPLLVLSNRTPPNPPEPPPGPADADARPPLPSPPLPSETRESPVVPAPTETSPPVPISEVERVPPPVPAEGGGLTVAGCAYRGASTPRGGEVLAISDASVEPVWIAGADGRFTAQVPAGLLRLLDEKGGSTLRVGVPIPAAIADEGGSATLNVHRSPLAAEPRLLTPVSALVLQCDPLGPPILAVRGRTDLPDGAELAVRVLVRGQQIESLMLRASGGEFGGVLRFASRQYHSGVYDLQFAWGPLLATERTRTALAGTRWSTVREEIREDRGIFLGTPTEASEQEEEITRYFREALFALEGATDIVRLASTRARQKRNRSLEEPDRVARMRGSELASSYDDLFAGRRLIIDHWRELVDERIPALVAPYLDPAAMPYPTRSRRAGHNLSQVAKRVAKLAKLESILLYKALGLDPDPRNYVAGCEFPPDVERGQTLEQMQNCIQTVLEELED